MYDVIVVGSRCAGSPTAMLLARKGYKVLLVDKATFPSDTMSTHFVHPSGTARLKRWELLDRVQATGCPTISSWHFDVGPFALDGAPAPLDGIAEAYAPRRLILDKILVDAAIESGADVREAFAVQELVTDGEQVAGIRGRVGGRATVTEKARLVIGADGRRSFVARSVQAPTYNTKPTLTCAYYSYWSGVAVTSAEVYVRPGRVLITFPTHDDLVVLYVAWPAAEFHAVRSDIRSHVMRSLTLAPGLDKRFQAGRQEGRFIGTADLPNFFRKPFGPGWALVGDAGYHKDPYLAQGISDAFRDAELLADAIDAGLSGRVDLDTALAGYEVLRNQAAMPGYELNCQLSTLQPPTPEMQQILAALIGNPDSLSQFLGALMGTVPITEFFSPQSIQRIVGGAVTTA